MYLVEDIIAERKANKHKEWLVRWKGRERCMKAVNYMLHCHNISPYS